MIPSEVVVSWLEFPRTNGWIDIEVWESSISPSLSVRWGSRRGLKQSGDMVVRTEDFMWGFSSL